MSLYNIGVKKLDSPERQLVVLCERLVVASRNDFLQSAQKQTSFCWAKGLPLLPLRLVLVRKLFVLILGVPCKTGLSKLKRK